MMSFAWNTSLISYAQEVILTNLPNGDFCTEGLLFSKVQNDFILKGLTVTRVTSINDSSQARNWLIEIRTDIYN